MKQLVFSVSALALAFCLGCCETRCELPGPACAPVTPCSDPCGAPVIVVPAPAATPAAAQPEEIKTVEKSDLVRRRFVLETLDGKPFLKVENMPSIEFNEDFSVNGRICNLFRGMGELENGILKVENMASTMMMCGNDEVNQFEHLFGQLMASGVAVSLDGNKLQLEGDGHVLVYGAADWVR